MPQGVLPFKYEQEVQGILAQQALERLARLRYIPTDLEIMKQYDDGGFDIKLHYTSHMLNHPTFILKVTKKMLDSLNMELVL